MARDSDQTICFCHNVSYGELIQAIAQGSTNLEAIKTNTCASTGCGGCENDVIDILAEETGKAPVAGVSEASGQP